jgi:SAM-dependent methyltransferase/uncharacterized protein YbaR (Trm112 family)
LDYFPWALLSELLCPYCGAGFNVLSLLESSAEGIVTGILGCDCYKYPVVAGIPVLRQISPVASTQNATVQCLVEGNIGGALTRLLASGSASGVPAPASLSGNPEDGIPLIRKLRDFARLKPRPPVASRILQMARFEEVLEAMRPRDYASYLFHRFANPSLLSAIPPLLMLGDACGRGPRRRFLDLLCGTGHSSATVGALCPGVEVIMADADFVNLHIARRFMAPGAVALCLDVELPLPFSDKSIDAVFCLDGLHYVRSKVALLKEVDRIVGLDGAWLFAHMHNAKGANANPGAPLDPAGYLARFAFGQQRLLPEREVSRQFQGDGSLDLTRQPSIPVLDSSDALTLVGARNESLWKRHSDLDSALFRRPDLLGFNPLYRLEKAADGLVAGAAWPSESLRRECTGTKPLLRETVHISSRTMEKIAAARAGGPITDEVRSLLRSFVLVSLPECYPRAALVAQ